MKKLLLVSAIFASATFAQDLSALKGRGSYGDAGCGLGSMAFGAAPGFVQILAVTTNGLFGSQTFGITTGTSNCSSSGVVLNNMEQDYYTEANYESLIQEMAQGHGENLSTLAALFEMDTEEFAAIVKSNYETIVINTSDANQLLAALRLVIADQQA